MSWSQIPHAPHRQCSQRVKKDLESKPDAESGSRRPGALPLGPWIAGAQSSSGPVREDGAGQQWESTGARATDSYIIAADILTKRPLAASGGEAVETDAVCRKPVSRERRGTASLALGRRKRLDRNERANQTPREPRDAGECESKEARDGGRHPNGGSEAIELRRREESVTGHLTGWSEYAATHLPTPGVLRPHHRATWNLATMIRSL